jgi:hypothetical protein
MAYSLTVSDEVQALVVRLQEIAHLAGIETRFVRAYGDLLAQILADPMGRGEIRNHLYGRVCVVLNAAIDPVAVRYAAYPGS